MSDRRVEIGHRQDRIRRGLDEDQVGPGGRCARLVELDDVDPRGQMVEQLAVAVVGTLREGDRAARSEQRQQDRRHGAHPGRIEQCVTDVERTERRFAGDSGRVVVARVREASGLSLLVWPGRGTVERDAHSLTLATSCTRGSIERRGSLAG